jgi:hypothetical protein
MRRYRVRENQVARADHRAVAVTGLVLMSHRPAPRGLCLQALALALR